MPLVYRQWVRAGASEGGMSEAGTIAILAALPREIRGLVGRAVPDAGWLARGVHLYRSGPAVVVTAGMGAARVSLAFEASLAAGAVRQVVSAGLAGACDLRLAAGEVAEAALVVDARTGERFRTAAAGAGAGYVLVTSESIAGRQEKLRLAATYGAAMVDMEAATVARLAQAHGLPFRAVKGISDAHDFELASLSRFAGAHGQFRTAAFALHTALRPRQWRHAARLGRDSNRALLRLQAQLRAVISQAGQD